MRLTAGSLPLTGARLSEQLDFTFLGGSSSITITLAEAIPADASGTLIADVTEDAGWDADLWPFAGDASGTLTTPTGPIAVTLTPAGALVEDTPGQWATACTLLFVGSTFTPLATFEVV